MTLVMPKLNIELLSSSIESYIEAPLDAINSERNDVAEASK
jgi:hypothetical protein